MPLCEKMGLRIACTFDKNGNPFLNFARKDRKCTTVGPVAQGLERTAHNGLVGGSIPSGPTNSALDPLFHSWRRRSRGAGKIVRYGRIDSALEIRLFFWIHAVIQPLNSFWQIMHC